MGRNRGVGTLAALRAIHAGGGGGVAGVAAFWRGTGPKLVESASKGAILVYAKESLNGSLAAMGVSPGLAGALAGAGGGVCQTTIMGPCTFLVTGAVTGNQAESTLHRIRRTWSEHGVRVRRPAHFTPSAARGAACPPAHLPRRNAHALASACAGPDRTARRPSTRMRRRAFTPAAPQSRSAR